MDTILYDHVEDFLPATLPGSAGVLKCGCAISKENRGTAPAGWVARDTTIIVGCPPNETGSGHEPTSVEWRFAINEGVARKAHSAVLLIGCDRIQGGLHSQTKGAIARINVNDNEVDLVGLLEIPPGHTDYFHRVPHQDIPPVSVIKNCGTVYSFSVPGSFLKRNGQETATVSLDPAVRWDIDHVVFVLKYSKRRIRSWIVAVIFTVLGAAAGVAATELWKLLAGG